MNNRYTTYYRRPTAWDTMQAIMRDAGFWIGLTVAVIAAVVIFVMLFTWFVMLFAGLLTIGIVAWLAGVPIKITSGGNKIGHIKRWHCYNAQGERVTFAELRSAMQ